MLLCETRLELSERLRRGLPYSSIDRLLGGCNVTIGRAVGDEDQWSDKSMTFSTGNTAGADANGDGSGCGCSENRTIVSVCKLARQGETANAFPFVPPDRQAHASRHGRSFLSPCLDRRYSELCSPCRVHNVTKCQGQTSTDRKVRDRDVQWLAWGRRR
jgi:hypothetical protein